MCLFCSLSTKNSTGKLSHISSLHFKFVLGTKQSVFCMLYVRVSYDFVKVFEESPEAVVWTSLKVCIAGRGQHSTSNNYIDCAPSSCYFALLSFSVCSPTQFYRSQSLKNVPLIDRYRIKFWVGCGAYHVSQNASKSKVGRVFFCLSGLLFTVKRFRFFGFRNTCTVSSFNSHFSHTCPVFLLEFW